MWVWAQPGKRPGRIKIEGTVAAAHISVFTLLHCSCVPVCGSAQGTHDIPHIQTLVASRRVAAVKNCTHRFCKTHRPQRDARTGG
jgi:hypothetical protein